MVGCVTCSGHLFYVSHRDVRILDQREGSQLKVTFQQLPERNDPHKYAPRLFGEELTFGAEVPLQFLPLDY